MTLGRTRSIAFGVVLVAAVAAATWIYVASPDRGPKQGGPLGPVNAHGSLTDVRLGQTMTDGLEVLELHGDEPATITDVEVIGGSGALQYLGAMIASPDRRTVAATQEFKTYPPRAARVAGTLTPAVGAVIKPVDQTAHQLGYELLIGYRYVANEVAARSTIRIHYTVGGQEYVIDDPARLVTCPTTISNDQCGRLADKLFPDG
jgi:hypothetical protein